MNRRASAKQLRGCGTTDQRRHRTLIEFVSSTRADLQLIRRVISAMPTELFSLQRSLAQDRRLGECVYQASWPNAVLRLVLTGMCAMVD